MHAGVQKKFENDLHFLAISSRYGHKSYAYITFNYVSISLLVVGRYLEDLGNHTLLITVTARTSPTHFSKFWLDKNKLGCNILNTYFEQYQYIIQDAV